MITKERSHHQYWNIQGIKIKQRKSKDIKNILWDDISVITSDSVDTFTFHSTKKIKIEEE